MRSIGLVMVLLLRLMWVACPVRAEQVIMQLGSGTTIEMRGEVLAASDYKMAHKMLDDQERLNWARVHPYRTAIGTYSGFYFLRSHVWTPVNNWGSRNAGACTVAGCATGIGTNVVLGVMRR